MCVLNPWSVSNKSTALHHFIIDNDLDVLALTETWLTGHAEDGPVLSNLLPPGYLIISEHRGSRGGGIAVIYRNTIPVKQNHGSQSPQRSFELLECTISLATCIRLCVIYRPERTRQQCNGTTFLEEFSEYLSSAVTSPGELLILGDFNYHVDDCRDPRARIFLQMLNDFNLNQYVTCPTHRSGHTLDLAICSADCHLISSCSALDCGFPDHFPVFIGTCLGKPHSAKKLVKYRKIKDISEAALSECIRSSPLLCDATLATRLEEQVDRYNTGLSETLDRLAPLRTKVITERHNCAWYTEELRAAKQRRRAAERIWRKTGLKVHREMYIAEKNKVNELADRAKESYYRDACK